MRLAGMGLTGHEQGLEVGDRAAAGQVAEVLAEAEHRRQLGDDLLLHLRGGRPTVEGVVVGVDQHGRTGSRSPRPDAAASASGRRSGDGRRDSCRAAAARSSAALRSTACSLTVREGCGVKSPNSRIQLVISRTAVRSWSARTAAPAGPAWRSSFAAAAFTAGSGRDGADIIGSLFSAVIEDHDRDGLVCRDPHGESPET